MTLDARRAENLKMSGARTAGTRSTDVREAGSPEAPDEAFLKRVPVILRSWDGPNSRLGLEVDLTQMPWGPFDALGKRLSLILPVEGAPVSSTGSSESQVERALRHVEHAADRCGEFAQVANGNRDLWLRSQETWEWIRRYLTRLWVEMEAGGEGPPESEETGRSEVGARSDPPRLPGAAATLATVAKALRSLPLATWQGSVQSTEGAPPTREEAVQTLLGLAKILGGSGEPGELKAHAGAPGPGEHSVPDQPNPPAAGPPHQGASSGPPPVPDGLEDTPDPDHVSFEFARGYDEGYQMGRRVGLALGSRRQPRPE